jgi:hypothetical protein
VPTKKPRLLVTLSPEGRAALERFSKVSGVAQSSFIGSLVDDAIPVLESMTRAFEAARKSPIEAAEIMNAALVETMKNAAQEQLHFSDQAKKRARLRRRPTRD